MVAWCKVLLISSRHQCFLHHRIYLHQDFLDNLTIFHQCLGQEVLWGNLLWECYHLEINLDHHLSESNHQVLQEVISLASPPELVTKALKHSLDDILTLGEDVNFVQFVIRLLVHT